MKKVQLCLLLGVVLLAGCAEPQPRSTDPVAFQCEYEATMATSGAGNPLMLGYQRQQLFVMCMRGKGR